MKKSNRLSLLALEPRLVFDGAIAVTQPDLLHPDDTTDPHDSLLARQTAWVGEAAAPAAPREVVIVDSALPDLGKLLAALPQDLEVLQINPNRDGLSQVLALLQGREGLGAIHILTHGKSGEFQLGTTRVNAQELQSAGQAWQQLGQYLSADGDLLVYGCDVAAGQAGQAFISELAHLTGADVAASTNRTGASAQADWTLEVRTAAVEASDAVARAGATWGGDLAALTVTAEGTFNEGSPWAVFTVSGAANGQVVSLDVLDGTTTKLDKTRVIYSQDGGANWSDYTVNVRLADDPNPAPVWFAQPVKSNGQAMLVAVDQSQLQDSSYQGLRSFQLSAAVLPGDPGYHTGNERFQISVEKPGVQKSSVTGSTAAFNFQSLTRPVADETVNGSNISVPGFGVFQKIGWQRNAWIAEVPNSDPAVKAYTMETNLMGGADSPTPYPYPKEGSPLSELQKVQPGLFASAGADSPVVLKLDQPANYLGLWWSSIGNSDRLDFYSQGVKVASVSGAELSQLAAYQDGTTYQSDTVAGDGTVVTKTDLLYRGNPNLPVQDTTEAFKSGAGRLGGSATYAFVNLFAKDGLVFDQVVASGDAVTGIFESDNWTVGSLGTTQASASSLVADNATGRIVQTDANGKPVVTSGVVQFAATALSDDDLATAPAGFWAVQPLDLLANDNGAASALNPYSVQLYSAATGGTGAKTLSSAQGFYSVDARGVLTFQPTAGFTGTDAIWYTVTDASGKVSERTQVTVSATATSAARSDTATTLTTAADGMVAVAHYGVDDVTVAENAGYAEFTVKGFEGSRIASIRVVDGAKGLAGIDTGLALEIYDGSTWVPYKDWDHLVPADSDSTRFEATSFKVRVRVNDDGLAEGSEDLKLQVEYVSGQVATAVLSITDNDTAGALTVEGVKISENSPYNVFTITAKEGDVFKLALESDTATVGVDVDTKLQWFDGLKWNDYVDGTDITVPNNGNSLTGESVKVLVRHFITEDTDFEGPESYNLIVKSSSGTPLAMGASAIVDDGSVSTTFAMGTSSATTRYVVPAIDVLANDFHDNGSLDRKSILLYLNDGSAVDPAKGVKSLTVAEGTYTVDDTTGMVNFKPSRAFTGTMATAIRYTVADNNGNRGVTSTIQVGVDSAVVTNTIQDTNALETLSGAAGRVSFVNQWSPMTVKLGLNANNFTGSTVSYTYTNPINLTYSYVDDKTRTKSSIGDAIRTMAGTFGSNLAYTNNVAVRWGQQASWFYTSGLTSAATSKGFDAVGGANVVGVMQVLANELYSLPFNDKTTGKPARYLMGQIVLTFSRPVNNPLIHVMDMGGATNDKSLGNIGYTTEFKLSTASKSTSAQPLRLVELSQDSFKNFEVLNGDTIANISANPNGTGSGGASGTVRVVGEGITSVVLDTYLWGKAYSGVAASWGTWYSSSYGGSASDLVGLGATVFDRLPESNPDGVKTAGTVVGVNEDGTPEMLAEPTAVAADDRPVAVNSLTVNEGSPYAVFTVSAYEGQKLNLTLANGTATVGTDTGKALEVWNGSAWVAYDATAGYTVPANANGVPSEPVGLLVRVAVTQDAPLENSETLTLTAVTSMGKQATGTLTILDNGEGTIFATTATTPGVNPDGTPVLDTITPKDDDRALPVAVNSLTVNEGSPFAVFTVSAHEGQQLALSLTNGTGTVGTDTGTTLQVWNGRAWVVYDPSAGYLVPADADGTAREPVNVYVRVAVNQDDPLEVSETVKLNVADSRGSQATGTLTILDNGQGTIFATTASQSGVAPDGSLMIDLEAPVDDDRPQAIKISNVRVKEDSTDWVEFTVTTDGVPQVKLDLVERTGSGFANIDETQKLQVWDASLNAGAGGWVDYTQGTTYTTPDGGVLKVRVSIASENDGAGTGVAEPDEVFYLRATPVDAAGVAGSPVLGTATILDDEAPITVNNVTVNEASPYLVFEVKAPQLDSIYLTLQDVQAQVGVDTTRTLEYFDATAQQWRPLSWADELGRTPVPVSDNGSVLVRLGVTQDTVADNGETFKLLAWDAVAGAAIPQTNERMAVGVGTILDDGTGSLFGAGNTTGTPDAPGTPGLPAALDDDRPIGINDVVVNEASPYMVFKLADVAENRQVQLSLSSLTATVGEDIDSTQLQWFNPVTQSWSDCTRMPNGSFVFTSPNGADANVINEQRDDLLVRVKVVQDIQREVSENYQLRVGYGDGSAPLNTAQSAVGLGTILDDGTGGIFLPTNNTGTPNASTDPGYPAKLDDDPLPDNRIISVNSLTLNEASPYAVFTVSGADGQVVGLSLKDGTAVTGGTAPGTNDYDPLIEYLDGSVWKTYDPGNPPVLPTGGTLLVRVPINQDDVSDNGDVFNLVVSNTAGTTRTGTCTILDNGTGDIVAVDANQDPVLVNGAPALDNTTLKDDDSPLAVNNVAVNEASPYLVFTVTAAEGTPLLLALSDGTGTKAASVVNDTTNTLEYFDGTRWVPYNGAAFTVPSLGGAAGASVDLLVRVGVKQDAPFEGLENLVLTATKANKPTQFATGIGTIVDDSTGTLFTGEVLGGDPVTATPVNTPVVLDPATAVLADDDRPLTVNDVKVNEGSPYLVFTVEGAGGQYAKLALDSGTAVLGVDTGTTMEYFDGTAWVPYTPGSFVKIPSDGNNTAGDLDPLLVRVAVKQDPNYEVSESFTLTATNTGGSSDTGTGTIVDDGTGTLFATNGTTPGVKPDGTPVIVDPDTVAEDDDRPLSVAGTTVYEAQSPYLAFTVTGIEGQTVGLKLNSGTGEVGVDTGSGTGTEPLQYWDGSAWKDYDPQNPPTIPQVGTALNGETGVLHVRIAVKPDTTTEPAESIELVATNVSGTPFVGTGYILDDASAAVVLDQPPLTVVGETVREGRGSEFFPVGNDKYQLFKVSGAAGQTLSLALATTGTGIGHADLAADLKPTSAGSGQSQNHQGSMLQYSTDGGTTWLDYTAAVTLTGTQGSAVEILVRTLINDDSLNEVSETYQLVATDTNKHIQASGVGTILDNENRGATPFVDSFTVNEGSPFGVFTVTGEKGASVSLELTSGTATVGTDTGTALEYFDTTSDSWKPYDSTSAATLPVVQPDGRLLVRFALVQDAPLEAVNGVGETLQLKATYVAGERVTPGGTATGIATIMDDGTGTIFLTRADDPLTPANEANLGVTDGGAPQLDNLAPKDDDRGVLVADVTVNEDSPFIVFTLDTFVGQQISLSVESGTATLGDPTEPGVDASSALEYYDGTAWVPYDLGSAIDVPASSSAQKGDPTQVLVRLAVQDDTPYEVSESFTLTASTATGKSDSATGTILDNGSPLGTIFTGAVASNGTPVVDSTTPKDDDRPVNPAFINDLRINEGSPWAVFTISGVPSAQITLELPASTQAGDAALGVDYQDGGQAGELQVFIGGNWVDYDPNATYPTGGYSGNNAQGSNAVLDSNGQLLVRVKLENQQPLEGDEPFQLKLQYTGNVSQAYYDSPDPLPQTAKTFTGTAIIVDDGTGVVFAADNPATSGVETGVGSDGKPQLVPTATAAVVDPAQPNALLLADDDRPLKVNEVTVNEGSPYIVLSVTGAAGQYVKLETASGTATLGLDTANAPLEYFDGTDWKAYTPGSFVRIPVAPGQTEGSPQALLVRLAVTQDDVLEVSESFTLTATNTGGGSATGLGTILDEGNGTVFATTPTGPTGVVLNADNSFTPVTNTAAPRDDDRPLQVTGTTVNEASPYVIWTVDGAQGQLVKLALQDGTGTVADDVTGPLEYFNGTAWVPYTPGSFVPVPTVTEAGQPGVLMVRTSPVVDAPYEMSETLLLQATNASHASAVGTSIILDNGTGPLLDGTVEPVLVTGQTVTEGSGAPLGFSVLGRPGEPVQLYLLDGTGSVLADTRGPLEVLVAGVWTPYTPGQQLALPADGALQVRVLVEDDAVRETAETLTLVAVPSSGIAAFGEGTILDNEPAGASPVVNSIEVNEASPYAVFTVEGVAGAGVTLTLADGSAKVQTNGTALTDGTEDYGTALQVFNGTAWVAYDANTRIGSNGKLLVRMAVVNDTPYEVAEQFKLTVAYNGQVDGAVSTAVTSGASSTGTATILDDGTGTVFLTRVDDPLTTGVNEAALGVDAHGNPQIDHATAKNDDRTLSVNSLKVNEGTPYAVFTVMAVEGEQLMLDLSSGTATVGTDTGSTLEVFINGQWVLYPAGVSFPVPQDGNGVPGQTVPLLVRVAIAQDVPLETASGTGEKFTLTASYVGGNQATAVGTCEILDDGNGKLFGAGNTNGTPDVPGVSTDPSLPAHLDNDRPLAVTGQTVNEASPYLVFTVTGQEGQPMTLSLQNGSATLGVDTGTALEVFNGSAWVPYTPGQLVMLPSDGDGTPNEPAQMLVRVSVVNDAPFEGAETLTLVVTEPDGAVAKGVGTIVDDGSGVINAKDDPNTAGVDESAPTAGNPLAPVPVLDSATAKNDDRGANPAVSDVTVNEGSPYAVFQVNGVAGAGVTLSLASGTATVGTDTGTELEVYNGSKWVPYTAASAIVPASGPLLVRVAINPDAPFEVSEQFTLTATYNRQGTTTGITVGGTDTGTGTILDDGTGDIFLASSSAAPSQPGDVGYPAALDDDRGIAVLGDTVYESDGHLVFTVSGIEGQTMTLSLGNGSALVGQDTGTQLQYWNGSAWVNYQPGALFTLPADSNGQTGDLVSAQFRVAVLENADGATPQDEQFTLTATTVGGKSATGTGTIKEGQRPQTLLDDDRPLAIDNITVNEGSPYAVFTVDGAPGQFVKLALGATNTGVDATLGTDTGTQLQYWDGDSWENYSNGSFVQIPAAGNAGHLLVRVAVAADRTSDNAETYVLRATNASERSAVGIGTILDDGTGTVFLSGLDDPAQPGVQNPSGVGPDGLPLTQPTASTPVADPAKVVVADDDRPLSVDNVTVNEGSPFAVFTVGGKEGQYVKLDLAPGTATEKEDYADALEYWDGDSWEKYDPGTLVKIPGDGDGDGLPNEAANLLVRVAIHVDTQPDNGETFTLTATNAGGSSVVGTGTIMDDGTGDVFAATAGSNGVPGVNNITTSTPVTPVKLSTANSPVAAPTLPSNPDLLADDDRPVTINDVEVNEASPYLVWTVGAKQGQYVKLAVTESGTGDGHAKLGTDTGTDQQLQYWDVSASKWQDYKPGTFVKLAGTNPLADGQLLVRLAVKNDFVFEDRETLTLTATNTGGTFDTGEGAIRDDGKGLLFGKDNHTAVPDTKEALGLQVLDDDRVAPPLPQPAAKPPAPPEAPAVPTAPALHVQQAVAEGRQAVSVSGGGSTAAVVSARAMGSRAEGINELHRTDQLIDKFERLTDPHLYVLPEVKDTRNQSFEARMPAIVMQSGLLMEELNPQNSVAALIKISQGPTSADQTLAELMEDKAAEQALARAQQEADEVSLGEKLAAHLMAAREAIKLEAQERQTQQRGQMGFSKQLQMARKSAAGAASYKG